MGKDSAGNYNHQIIFAPKLFMQLYYCDGLELHPVGLVNCGKRCKSYVKAKKKLTVIEAPNILTIVLKRFQSGNLEKLNKPVQFPEVLNFAPYMSGMSDRCPIYHLYAVVVYLNTMNAAYSGHYISYGKDLRGQCFRIDDITVSLVELETMLSAEAYILFYSRRIPQGTSLLANNSMYSDGKTKRSADAVAASPTTKKKNWKSKPSSSNWYKSESTMLHQESERHFCRTHPKYSNGNHIVDSIRIILSWIHRVIVLPFSVYQKLALTVQTARRTQVQRRYLILYAVLACTTHNCFLELEASV